ncbi:MAG TPA: radical SAM protein [Candidatus Nanoarchaeia archaeon]|nr:radical SAM protein [Candidatus Nanoarchaeia archaeon]
MAKVLLINPPWTKKGGNIWKSVSSCMPPHGLAILGALLEQEGHQVQILDTHAERIALDELQTVLTQRGKNVDFVGLTGSTMTISYSYRTAEICKKAFPNAKTILGGVHASSKPHEAAENPNIDFVVRGEGEYTFLELLNGKQLSDIRGLTYKERGRIIHNVARTWIKDLDGLPMPAYHLLPIDKYFPAVGSYKRLPAISMVTGRGCPGKCTFCYQPYGTLLRQRSPKKIFEEVQLLVEKYGVREICFYDDNFTTLKPRIREFCQLLIDADLDITWSCFSRVDWADLQLMKLMKKAGCHQVMFGVESGSQKILDNIRKQTTLERIRHAVAIAKAANIDIRAAFMFGNPGETEETMQQTIDFALELNPDIAMFNIATPNPGTQMYAWAEKEGLLSTENWEQYDIATPVLTLPTVRREQVLAYYRKAYRKFYLRPTYVWGRLAKLRTFADFRQLLAGFRGIIDAGLRS